MTAGAGVLAAGVLTAGVLAGLGLDSAANASGDATDTATKNHVDRLQFIRCIKPARGLLLLISCL